MEGKLQIIIFSYNRALQLNTLLGSVKHFLNNPFTEIYVLYNTSDDSFDQGYERLKMVYGGDVHFIRELPNRFPAYSWGELTNLYNLKLLYRCPHLRGHRTDFRRHLLDLFSHRGYTLFLTDDSVLIRPVILSEEDFEWLRKDPKQRQLSLRHGLELVDERTVEYKVGRIQWRFSDYNTGDHWGYRFSLDGHIYGNVVLAKLLNSASFNNPNTLESSGLLHVCHDNLFREGRCATHISLLSYPINIVQNTFTNESMDADTAVLNDSFIKGFSLQYPLPKKIVSFQVYPELVRLVRGSETIVLPTQMSKK